MQVLATVAPVILLLGMGKLFSLKKILTPDTIRGMKYLVSNIMLPVVIFNALISAVFTKESIVLSLIVYAVFTVIMYLSLRIGKKINGYEMTGFLMAGAEGGMFGYPLYIALYGASALSTLLIIDLGNILFAFTFFIVTINIYNNRDADRKKILIDSLKSPLVLITAAAILLNVTGIAGWFLNLPAAQVYNAVQSAVTAPVTALVLITVGYDLSFDRKLMGPVLKAGILRLLLMSLSAAALLIFAGGLIREQQLRVAVLLYFSLPPQFITPIFVKDEGEREFTATAISLYSLVTVLAFVLITVFVPLY